MNSLADALVFAVTYINYRDDRDEGCLDDDVAALESIAAYLRKATEEEKDALAVAAERALAAEREGMKRAHVIIALSTWMEAMFGDPWKGNKKV